MEEVKKSSLHIIALTGRSVAYNVITHVVYLNSCDLFFVILVTHMKQLQNMGPLAQIQLPNTYFDMLMRREDGSDRR